MDYLNDLIDGAIDSQDHDTHAELLLSKYRLYAWSLSQEESNDKACTDLQAEATLILD